MTNNNLFIGSFAEILPAYDMDSRARTHFDEITACECEVIAIYRDGYVDVRIKGTNVETNIHCGRLRAVR